MTLSDEKYESFHFIPENSISLRCKFNQMKIQFNVKLKIKIGPKNQSDQNISENHEKLNYTEFGY